MTDNQMIPFAPYCTVDILNAFQWVRNCQKLPISTGVSQPPSNILALRVRIPNNILIRSAVFGGLMVMTNRHTDQATLSIAIDHI